MKDKLSAPSQLTAKRTFEQASALPDARTGGAQMHPTLPATVHDKSSQTVLHKSPEEEGLQWSGYAGAFVEVATGRVLKYGEAVRRLGPWCYRRL